MRQDANIKPSSVATDVPGSSGRDMLAALIKGERDPETLAEPARGEPRAKLPELKLALRGHVRPRHQFLLERLLDHLAHVEQPLACFSERIAAAPRPFCGDRLFQRLDAVPGVNRAVVEDVVAEIGSDMRPFPTAGHLSSWAGTCPGNEESAGQRKRRRTTKGSVWQRRAMCQAAWAASRTKDSYFQARCRRLAGRRGKKRAALAVGHSRLVVIDPPVKHPDVRCEEPGGNHFAPLDPERLRRRPVKRLESQGYEVPLNAKAV